MDKEIITRNFSRCAYFYDKYADVQKRVALEMLSGIRGRNFSKVLEIGCGTGNYTMLLREEFKKAKILALDISGKMVEFAREKLKDKHIDFLVSDGESPAIPAGSYDLITSNACFQWFIDLGATLRIYKNLLKKNGLISFSIFGPLTFWELSVSLGSTMENASIAANNFINKNKIEKIICNNFKGAAIKEMIYGETFTNIMELLNKIKYTGIRGDVPGNKIYMGAKYFKKLEDVYLNKFQQIKVTYQIYFCQGFV